MKSFLLGIVLMVAGAALAAPSAPASAAVAAPVTAKVCVPKRNASGDIVRSRAAVYAFKKANPCPLKTKHPANSCPGYVVDHIEPLCACGLDKPSNMQWQKRNASLVKDQQEKKLCAVIRKNTAAAALK